MTEEYWGANRLMPEIEEEEEMQVPDSDEFKEDVCTPAPRLNDISNVGRASWLVSHELMMWALELKDDEREDFFDGRNRDHWMRAFAERLLEKVKRDSSVRASND